MIFDLEKVKLPRKISPDPIEEAIVEIRFESDQSSQEVTDQLLVEFGKDCPIRKELPIAQFPKEMRDQDPQLRYLPTKQLIKGGLILQIGGRVISIVNKKPYVGWQSLKNEVRGMAERLQTSKVVGQYQRLGIRYLNLLDCNLLDKINIVLSSSDRQIIDEKIDFRLSLNQDRFQAAVKLSNNVHAVINDRIINGSVIDIDAFTVDFQESELMSLIEDVHIFEKKLFFAVLKESFVQDSLKPDWN